jgi:hypothetical protein
MDSAPELPNSWAAKLERHEEAEYAFRSVVYVDAVTHSLLPPSVFAGFNPSAMLL